jgi:hypothetical protein
MLSARSAPRAEALPTDLRENFPPDMLALRQYVVWRYEKRVGKSAKIPYVADGSGARASADREEFTGSNRESAAVAAPAKSPSRFRNVRG